MALKRKYQVLVAKEPQAGVLATGLVDAANAKILPIDPVLTIDVENVERSIVRGTLTPATPIQGLISATFTFGVELSGSVSAGATDIPVWDELLQACGFKAQPMFVTALTSISLSGYLLAGETLTATGTGACVFDCLTGQSVLRYAADAAMVGTSVVGATSGNTATVNATHAQRGRAWRPTSTSLIELTYTSGTAWAAGDLLKGGTSGAILKAQAAGSTSGTAQFEVLYGTITGGEVFAGIAGSAGAFTYTTGTVEMVQLPTLSMALVEDGVIKTLRGCRGTVSFSAEIGQPVIMNFEFKGVLSSIDDGVAVSGVSYDTPVPPKFLGVDFQVAGESDAYSAEFTPRIASAGFDFGNTVSLIKDATDSGGNLWAEVTGRAPTASFDPEVLPEAAFAFLDKYTSGETLRVRMAVGTSAGNRFKLYVPALKLASEGAGDRDGFGTRELAGSLSGKRADGNDGEDCEFWLTYESSAINW
jgi:hypothetical protein